MRRKKAGQPLDKHFSLADTGTMLQLNGNNKLFGGATLGDLRRGDAAVLEGFDLPKDEVRRLMELGFLPGARITAGLSAPGGDPRVFQVDGSEIALRRETARRLKIRLEKAPRTR
jgi:ferrous iron transport protein A